MDAQKRSRRKFSGGIYHASYKKKQRELARFPAMTSLGERKAKPIRTRAAHKKTRLLSENKVNLVLPDGKIQYIEIKNVLDNPANKHLARRNVMTKGGIIDTAHGKARVTSRPGQDGVLNAVLLKSQK